MKFIQNDYYGDDVYHIDDTGDCCVGDEVRFEQAIFSGSYRNAKLTGFELITGRIIRESYGKKKQQHTFTIELENGELKLIKGRNLYRNGVWRKEWEDEDAREVVLEEKHERGKLARAAREERFMEKLENFYFS